jgi:hypothetical protein
LPITSHFNISMGMRSLHLTAKFATKRTVDGFRPKNFGDATRTGDTPSS